VGFGFGGFEMLRLRFSSAQLKCLFLLSIILLFLPRGAGSAPAALRNRENSAYNKALSRMMLPGTQDLQLIVELSDPGVLERMSANSTPLTGAGRLSERNRRIDLQSQQALAYRQQVSQNKEAIKSRILQFPGAQVQGTTEVVMNTVIVRVRASDYNSIRKLPGVKKVYFSRPRKMMLDQAAILQNAQALWTADGGQTNAGQGIKIGLIDSGIDINNPMFSGSGMLTPSGYPKYGEPQNGTNADKAFTNSKVIVARSYVSLVNSQDPDQTAKDEVGHGTFVAGCAAGQKVTTPANITISGMAPGAWLGSYKVFGTPSYSDTTNSAAIIQAMDDAVSDGMDVISLSLGALDYVPPADENGLGDGEIVAIENAIQLDGRVVTIAAGNEGRSTHTIGSPGTADDAITVGSVTNSRELLAAIQTPVSTIGYLPSADGIGISSTISAPIVDIKQSLDPTGLGCSAFSGSLSGSIALIERGACGFSVKGANAAAAGAQAAIIYNNDPSGGIAYMGGLGSVSIPVVAISNSDGTNLQQYVDSHPGTLVSIDTSQTLVSVPATARVISSFSSVGPNMDFSIKPDLVAVGENVYSAATTSTTATLYNSTGFTTGSGTSFSTPMVAGAAAALLQHFPTLQRQPLAIKSLLTTTATGNVTVDGTNAANVLQAGSGLLNMGNAVAATAVFSPTSLSYGVHSYTGSYSYSLPLAITNLPSSASDQFTLGVIQVVPGASIAFDQNNVSIGAGSTATINVSIQVTAPNSGGFQGLVTVTSKNTSFVYRIPYWAGVYVPDPNTVLPVLQSASGSGSYSDLTDAFAAAQPGNIIEIQDSATYSVGQSGSGLIISTNSQGVPLHGITIRAASNQTPVIDGSTYLNTSDYPADIEVIGLQNVLLQRLTINGGYVGVELYQPSPSVPLSVTIDQSAISNSAGSYDPSGIWPSYPVGVWIDGGGVVDITNSTVSGSAGTGIISGYYADGTQLTVANNSTVQGNGNDGLDAFGSNVDIFNSSFTSNQGAGSALINSSGTVKGNTFAQNQTFEFTCNNPPSNQCYSYGDGLLVYDGNLVVQNNQFDSNNSYGAAGLEFETASSTGFGPTVQVLGNTMSGNGYGIYSGAAVSVVADSNLIEDNAQGIYLYYTSSALLTNDIIVRSTDSQAGYGVVIDSGSSARIINDTVYQNALQGVVLSTAGSSAYVANSIVYGNGGSNLGGIPSGSVVPSVALTTSNPQFNNPSAGDFSLQAGSPAIDAGTNSVQGLPFLDYSGRLRVASATGAGQGTVDMGALEAHSLYPLVFPLAANGSQSSIGGTFTTGVALLNRNSSPAQVNLTAYTSTGSVLGTSTNPPNGQPLGVESQLASLYWQLFGFDQNAAEMGSVLATSNSKLAGFSLIFDRNFSLFSTGTNATAQAGTDLVFMRHDPDANGSTNYYVVTNPGVNATNITATLYNTTGQSIGQKTATIAPKAQTVFNFSSSTAGYVAVQQPLNSNIVPLSGVELVGNSTRQAALGAFSPSSEARIFFPHYAVGSDVSTQIGIVNSSLTSVANVTLTAYDNNADLVGTTSFQIAAGGQFLGSVADVFQIPTGGATQVGYLVAQGDQPGIMGYTDFTYYNSNGSPIADATVPADSVPSNTLLFSQIANGVPSGTGALFWTGIALVNPFGTQVPYTMTVYDQSGNSVATGSYTLGPHHKVSKVLSSPVDSNLNDVFFAQNLILQDGYIVVSSSYGVIGVTIYYTQDLSQMASVPAQTQ
jgi:subtilisin family serine protease